MRILVIGASSFTGGAFIRRARSRGHDVFGDELRRPAFDMNTNLPGAAADHVLRGYENVVNFAALNMVAESWSYAPDYYRTNVAGVAALAAAVRGLPLRCFLQVSTPEVYGNRLSACREGDWQQPSTPYALSRSAADQHLGLLHRQHGFPVRFTRTVNVYGPGQQAYRIVPKTAVCALTGARLGLDGGGRSERSFIHVDDVADGIIAVMERGRDGQTYHMATARMTAIRDLVEMVAARCGVPTSRFVVEAPERPGKDHAYVLNDRKIRDELGWAESITLEDGLDQTVEWVRGNIDSLREQTHYRHAA